MSNNKPEYYCRVCGLFQGQNYPPWGWDGKCPSFDICECCGIEFGYNDCFLEDVKKARKEWLDKGAPWDSPEEKPQNWSLEDQLKNIPSEFM